MTHILFEHDSSKAPANVFSQWHVYKNPEIPQKNSLWYLLLQKVFIWSAKVVMSFGDVLQYSKLECCVGVAWLSKRIGLQYAMLLVPTMYLFSGITFFFAHRIQDAEKAKKSALPMAASK